MGAFGERSLVLQCFAGQKNAFCRPPLCVAGGNAEDLVVFTDREELVGDCGCHPSANVGIDLIKDQHRDFVGIAKNGFDGQHDTGDFTAAGDLTQREHLLANIGGKGEFNRVGAIGPGIGVLQAHLEGGPAEAEMQQLAGDFFGRECGRLFVFGG